MEKLMSKEEILTKLSNRDTDVEYGPLLEEIKESRSTVLALIEGIEPGIMSINGFDILMTKTMLAMGIKSGNEAPLREFTRNKHLYYKYFKAENKNKIKKLKKYKKKS